MKINVIFTSVGNKSMPPFGHLYQLDKVGIDNILILLNEEEFKKANETKFQIFDGSGESTIIEHYQSQSKRLNIEVINTGSATTDEEKLNFYQKHADGQYGLNLVLCQKSNPWTTDELSAKLPVMESIEYSFLSFPFFKSAHRPKFPLFQSPCSSDKAVELLEHDLNPCFCYKLDKCDLNYYQWLFNIFVELIELKLKLAGDESAEYAPQLKVLISNFNKIIPELDKAEVAFETTHKRAFATFDEPGRFARWAFDKNATWKANLEDKFPELIDKLVNLYSELASQKYESDFQKSV